jgi:hypothetical protein
MHLGESEVLGKEPECDQHDDLDNDDGDVGAGHGKFRALGSGQ